jgi:hypothetical protein
MFSGVVLVATGYPATHEFSGSRERVVDDRLCTATSE